MNIIKKLSSSLEDYLEAILVLEQKNRVARVKDISAILSVQMPSVTGALKNLRELGLIEYEKNSFITLTENGKMVAECILGRHRILLRFFNEVLGLEGKLVENQACSIEHSINHDTAVRIAGLTDWITSTVFEEQGLSMQEWVDLLKQKETIHQ